MATLDEIHAGLTGELDRLASRYLDQYFPANPEHTPDIFEYDVKSYAILSHAAFEEFVESVSEIALGKIASDIMSQKISLSTVSLIMAYKQASKIEENESLSQPTCYAMVREAVDLCKVAHSNVLEKNHGFSVKYLRALLVPVGINVPSGPEIDAVKKLADARGSFAHTAAKRAMYGKYKQATKVLTPDEAKDAVKDCLEVCDRIKVQADAVVTA